MRRAKTDVSAQPVRPARPGVRGASPAIDVTVLCRRWRRAVPRASALCRTSARAALAGQKTMIPGAELSIVLADNAMLQMLNMRYRKKNKPTNVLAFPAQSGDVLSDDGDPSCALGDVVLAYETIRAEALAGGRPMAHHLCHLVVHGVLHLLGHDHHEIRAARRMERLERDALANMGIPDPYDSARMAVTRGRRRA